MLRSAKKRHIDNLESNQEKEKINILIQDNITNDKKDEEKEEEKKKEEEKRNNKKYLSQRERRAIFQKEKQARLTKLY